MGERCSIPTRKALFTIVFFSFCEAYYLSIKFFYCFAYLGDIDI